MSGNIPVMIAISLSLGALTVPPPCATGRAPLASSDIHWRTIPLPVALAGAPVSARSRAWSDPFSGADILSAAALRFASTSMVLGVPEDGRGTLLRGALRAVVTTSSSARLTALLLPRALPGARGSGNTRCVRRTGLSSPRRGFTQFSASLTSLWVKQLSKASTNGGVAWYGEDSPGWNSPTFELQDI